jgi:hypothetical protein
MNSISAASALSLMQAMNGSTTGVLGALFGGTQTSSGNPIQALQTAIKNETADVANEAKQPAVARDIAAFRKAVASASSPQALLADPVARKVLLTANGLGDQTDYGALATKALMSDTSKSGSLASQLTNTQWLTAAKTYDFANKGLSVLKSAGVVDSIANGYAEVLWRQSLDQTTPGLSNALDFRSRASTITSADQILGDPTFREVVLTGLGVPQQIAFQTLGAQEKAITDRVDITKFKDPTFVDQFTRRYLVQASLNSSTSTTGSSGLSSSLLV